VSGGAIDKVMAKVQRDGFYESHEGDPNDTADHKKREERSGFRAARPCL